MPLSRPVGLAQIMLLLVVFGVPEYFRDVTMAPLYGERILFVDLYLLGLSLLLCRLRASEPQFARAPGAQVPAGGLDGVFISTMFATLVFFAGAFYHNPGVSFFVPLQLLVTGLTLGGLILLAQSGQIEGLLDKADRALTLIVLLQLAVLAIGQAVSLPMEATASRNMWSYLAVLLFSLNRFYSRPGALLLFLKVVAIITINSTKAAFALLAAVIVAHLLQRAANRHPVLRFLFCVGFLGTLVAAYFVAYHFAMQALHVGSLEAFEYLGRGNGAEVNNQLESGISRVFSVPYTLKFVIEHNAIIGVGATEAATITFWGYPVHNLFVSYIAIYGVFGLAFSLLYLALCFWIARGWLAMFAIAAFAPMVSNDLYPMTALCLLPLTSARFRTQLRALPRLATTTAQ